MANEKRLIDANALKEKAISMVTVNSLGNKQHCYFKAVGTHEIDKAPTVDAVEVVHGRWVKVDHYPPECSICGDIAPLTCDGEAHYMGNYCPNCGAKMDGGKEDE